MNKIKTIATSALAVAAVVLGITTLVIVAKKPTTVAVQGAETSAQATAPQTELSFTATRGANILEQTKTHASVETQDSSYGPFVTTINGVRGGTDNKYWSFYINDALAQKGAADYWPEGGDGGATGATA